MNQVQEFTCICGGFTIDGVCQNCGYDFYEFKRGDEYDNFRDY